MKYSDIIKSDCIRYIPFNFDEVSEWIKSLSFVDAQNWRGYVIYFLMKNDEISYIGHSTEIEDRIKQHKANKVDFDGVLSIGLTCGYQDALLLENWFINVFDPPLNKLFLRAGEKLKKYSYMLHQKIDDELKVRGAK